MKTNEPNQPTYILQKKILLRVELVELLGSMCQHGKKFENNNAKYGKRLETKLDFWLRRVAGLGIFLIVI